MFRNSSLLMTVQYNVTTFTKITYNASSPSAHAKHLVPTKYFQPPKLVNQLCNMRLL
uniref:Uncharacterized protein n=1 Tax=Anguilla anguilla TaxID=7936 RepID=A0A0E9S8N2_ANGAN